MKWGEAERERHTETERERERERENKSEKERERARESEREREKHHSAEGVICPEVEEENNQILIATVILILQYIQHTGTHNMDHGSSREV